MIIRRNPHNKGVRIFKQSTQFDTEFIENFSYPAGSYAQRNRGLISTYTDDTRDFFREVANLFKTASALQMRINGVPFTEDSIEANRLCDRFLTAYMVCEYRKHNYDLAAYYSFVLLLKVKRILKGLDTNFNSLSDAAASRLVKRIGDTFKSIANYPDIESLYSDY